MSCWKALLTGERMLETGFQKSMVAMARFEIPAGVNSNLCS
jgi:hypothetical protein